MIYSSTFNPINIRDIQLESVMTTLKNQISKATSRRLHLQSLISKRDRLDYEILKLKKRIREDQKEQSQKKFRESTRILLETLNGPEFKSRTIQEAKVIEEINADVQLLETELKLLAWLLEQPRLY